MRVCHAVAWALLATLRLVRAPVRWRIAVARRLIRGRSPAWRRVQLGFPANGPWPVTTPGQWDLERAAEQANAGEQVHPNDLAGIASLGWRKQ